MCNFNSHRVLFLATEEAAPTCLARRHSRQLGFGVHTPKTPPAAAFARYPSARRVSRSRGSRLHHWVAGSSVAQAESSSLSYGWIVHLRLLSTRPHGHAVTFSYELESVWLGKDLHLSIHARLQARHPACGHPLPRGDLYVECRAIV